MVAQGTSFVTYDGGSGGGVGQASFEASLFAALVTLAALYSLGSYATSRLAGLAVRKGAAEKALFYGLVAPGVVLHETAHLLGCVLSGTAVSRFSPFSPETSADGRILLGRVEHARRGAPVEAAIGLMPLLVNPIGVVAVTVWLTPLPATELLLAGTPWGAAETMISALAETAAAPGGAAVVALWAYLAGSFALGSVPSREDLASVPAALLLAAGVAAALIALGLTDHANPTAAVLAVSRAVCGLYALPVAVAALAAASAFGAGLLASPARGRP